jgi:hypothetical protein
MPRFAPLLALPFMSCAIAAFAHPAALPHTHGAEVDASLTTYAVAGLAFALSGAILLSRRLRAAKA